MERDNYWVDASQMSTDNYSTIGSHRNVNLSYDDGKTNSLSKSMLADSMKTNIKTATNKIVQLERYITLATWFLMVFSIIATFYAFLLIKWYFMPNLYFWDPTFYIAPYSMLLMGVYTFLVTMFGLIMKGYEKRRWFVIYAVLLSIAFIGQLTSLYFTWQITTILSIGTVGGSHVVDSLSNYQIDSKVTNSWDDMQTRLMCCGGNNWNTGYADYRGTPIGQSSDSVPDSCCISPNQGCGRGVLKESPIVVRDKIFVHGCVEILTRRLNNEVVNIITIYAGVSLFVALVEIVTVALASAYVAKITRRRDGDEIL
jgi:hypothetical protein